MKLAELQESLKEKRNALEISFFSINQAKPFTLAEIAPDQMIVGSTDPLMNATTTKIMKGSKIGLKSLNQLHKQEKEI